MSKMKKVKRRLLEDLDASTENDKNKPKRAKFASSIGKDILTLKSKAATAMAKKKRDNIT